jgi:hypothetical protein
MDKLRLSSFFDAAFSLANVGDSIDTDGWRLCWIFVALFPNTRLRVELGSGELLLMLLFSDATFLDDLVNKLALRFREDIYLLFLLSITPCLLVANS